MPPEDEQPRFESWIDRQIREAMERGEFDDLPGAGKPIPGLGGVYDPDWWLKSFIRREGVGEAGLSPGLALRKERQQIAERLAEVDDEDDAREVVEDLNRRIKEHYAAVLRGPGPKALVPLLDVDAVLAAWRRRRQPPA